MSIATSLQRLQAAKTAITNAIIAKGGTVTQGDGYEDFPSDIATIPQGGGQTDRIVKRLTGEDIGDITSTASGNIIEYAFYNHPGAFTVTANAATQIKQYAFAGSRKQVLSRLHRSDERKHSLNCKHRTVRLQRMFFTYSGAVSERLDNNSAVCLSGQRSQR